MSPRAESNRAPCRDGAATSSSRTAKATDQLPALTDNVGLLPAASIAKQAIQHRTQLSGDCDIQIHCDDEQVATNPATSSQVSLQIRLSVEPMETSQTYAALKIST